MTAEEVKIELSKHRDLVINYYKDNCKEDRLKTLKWYMCRVLQHAEISWSRRKNITEKDVNSVIKGVMKSYPQLKKGYISNWQKAVNYYGLETARLMAEAN